MFKELPAWGFYIRHASGITFDNVMLIADKEDYRTAIVLDDVHGAKFTNMVVKEPGPVKEWIFSARSTKIETQK
ncbi:MAG: hypothetical protein R2727_12290 [Bacteroidales bacterium]